LISDLTQQVLVKAVDAAALRHRALSNNIANVETPGYTREDVSFESELRMALDGPGSSSIQEREVRDVRANVQKDTKAPAREDGNNVDIDREMTALAENTLNYQALLQSLSIKGQILRTAIYEGKR
jgi:flagellar basal-body rod protein FlgB